MGLNTGALGQSASTFYDRATYTIRQIFDDPVRCAPGQHASQAWSEWSKCIAEGTERISRLFDYSPGVVRVVDDYKNKVQVIGQMIDDHILKRDDALKEIAAERDRLMKTLTPLIEGRVYREASGQR